MREDDNMDLHRIGESRRSRMNSSVKIRPITTDLTATRAAAKRLALLLLLLCAAFVPAEAQISLAKAVDLALGSNPRVQGAQSDVEKARAQLSEAHDAYIPSVNAGMNLGQSYGYSSNPPTLFTVTGGSLVYSPSQISYIRSAKAGINAAQLALDDIREAVAEDTALAFLALDHDQQREQVVGQQAGFAKALVGIVQERIDAGQDAPIELTQAKLSAAQLRLASLHAADETALDRERLAHLIGQPADGLRIDVELPASLALLDSATNAAAEIGPLPYANAGVASAFASAEAKQQVARADAHFRFRPQINLFAQYNFYATWSNSFAQLQKVYQANTGQTSTLGFSEGAFGVQIIVPIFDRGHSSKARESAADAAHAFHLAQSAQIDTLDGQSSLRHSITELQAQTDVATLQQQLAQQQLDILQQQLKTGNPDGPQMTPKDEQNARINERGKFLAVLDANYQLRTTEIHLLRQTGELLSWLKSATTAQIPAAPTPQP
jgi:outer membrane protein TolC